MNHNFLLVAAIAAISASAHAQATLTLSADRDATLYESNTGDLANGAGAGLFVGVTGQPKVRRTLVRFDLSSIPAGSRIVGASVITNSTLSSSASPLDTDWHRVLTDWSEGASIAPGNGGGGTTALPGDATWLHSSYPSSLWTNVAGDFATNPSFSMPIQALGLSSSGYSAGLIADVQDWLDNPSNNFGWLVKSDETVTGTATRIESRESTGGGIELTVSYVSPGMLGTWGLGCVVTGPGWTTTMGLNLSNGPANSGTTIQLNYTGSPRLSIGATFYSLELGLGPNGVGTPVGPSSCTALLPLNNIVPGNLWTTDAVGAAGDSFTIPLNSPGFLVACQGAAIDTTPAGFALSNAGIMLTQ